MPQSLTHIIFERVVSTPSGIRRGVLSYGLGWLLSACGLEEGSDVMEGTNEDGMSRVCGLVSEKRSKSVWGKIDRSDLKRCKNERDPNIDQFS